MEGIITALVAFIFVCIVYPRLVRNKAQFYMAIVAVLGIMLVWLVGNLFNLPRFAIVVIAMFQVAGFVLLILATGGLSLGELTGEIGNAFGSLRQGEDNKVVPMAGQMPRPKGGPAPEPERVVYHLDDPPPAAPPASPPKDEGKIPLE